MKKSTVLLIFTFFSFGFINAQDWHYSLSEAKKIAIEENKLIYLSVYNWGGNVPNQNIYGDKYLQRKTDFANWTDEELNFLNQNYVLLSLDWNEIIQYNLTSSVNLLDSNGKLLSSMMDRGKQHFTLKFIHRYAFDRAAIKNALENYIHNQTPLNAVELGFEYQLLALGKENDVAKELIQLSHRYFGEAKKAMNEFEFRTTLKQYLKLVEIHENIVIGENRKSFRLLNDLTENEIEASNLNFYYFLNYLVYSKRNHVLNMNKWKAKLEDEDIKRMTIYF